MPIGSLTRDYLPLYHPREASWDPYSIHGRLHILRCLHYAERMMAHYLRVGIPLDEEVVRIALLFHDAGREGHGADIWEVDSARLARKAMEMAGYETQRIELVRDCILRERMDSLEAQIVRDADVLDYHRFMILPQEASFFQQDRLLFASLLDRSGLVDLSARERLIAFARYLVQASERLDPQAGDEELITSLEVIAASFGKE